MKKQSVLLVGPFVGELYWECFRFAPWVFYQQKKHFNNLPLVVLTRPDRYDIYGARCTEFKPLEIKGDNDYRFGECFRMMGLEKNDYLTIAKYFRIEMEKKYNIVEHFLAPFDKPDYLNKDYYPLSQRIFEYYVRKDNRKLIHKFLKDVTKPIVIIAPRFRKNFKRNWPYWQELYDKLYDTKWTEKIEFIICGKQEEYVPDKYKRFKDINDIKLTKNSSLFGLLLQLMTFNNLTIGSQSAIPNISLLFKKPVIEWGNQKKLHTVTYNIYNTHVDFFETNKFDIKLEQIFNKIVVELTKIILKKETNYVEP